MLNPAKKSKMIASLKNYKKTYLDKQYGELDESATRLMINHFLTEILGFKMIEEIKTEFMIRGTYADYVVQINGIRYFLVEVKALSIELSEKHLRQAINYGANEGIEWIVLTNARKLELYKILFEKPIEGRKVFSIDLQDSTHIKEDVELLQYLHKESVMKKELDTLWKKHSALKSTTIAGFLFGKPVVTYLKRELKNRYKSKFSDEEIIEAIKKVIIEQTCLDNVKPIKEKKKKETKEIPVNGSLSEGES
jgi:predicted type IV restriction endonuclease